MTATLELRSVSKRFGAVQALHDADFVLEAGELHALLGENGAGKSTLMSIANGMLRPDSGELLIGGQQATLTSPSDARRHGIGMVHQHFSAVPAFTVAQNLALAAGWDPAPGALRPRVEALMHRVGLRVPGDARAESLSVAQRQALEILMALAGEARILLLDEPTAVLAPADADSVLQVVRQFTRQGGAAVLITHKFEEALTHADRITVLRRGHVQLSAATSQLTSAQLAEAMLGTAPPVAASPARSSPGRIMARCRDLVVAPDAGGSGLRGASLDLRAGEVCGLAAVEGNGERELIRSLAGLLQPSGGRIELEAVAAFIPEDRTTEALIPGFTLTENRALGNRGTGGQRGRRRQWLNWKAEREATSALIAAGGVVAAGPEARARELSGGNQQRFVVARALESSPGVVLAENPGRGLDFKAAAEVQAKLRTAARGGAAVLFFSVDLDEVLEVSDRVVVLHQGVIVEPPPGADRPEIGRLMLGGAAQAAP